MIYSDFALCRAAGGKNCYEESHILVKKKKILLITISVILAALMITGIGKR